MIISCIHSGEKTPLKIKYHGEEKKVSACPACVSIINESSVCEVIS